MSNLVIICVLYTLYRMSRGIWWLWGIFVGDRSGNSGRYGHVYEQEDY